MKLSIGILILFFLVSCGKVPSLYRATLYNPTDHYVKILFYKSGIVYPDDTLRIVAGDQVQIAYGPTGRGSKSGEGRGFNSDYFGSSQDSIIVIFDSLYPITHYIDSPSNLSENYYLFSSSRNLANPYSYEYAVVKENGDVINDHKYYFTEQDYLGAKD